LNSARNSAYTMTDITGILLNILIICLFYVKPYYQIAIVRIWELSSILDREPLLASEEHH